MFMEEVICTQVRMGKVSMVKAINEQKENFKGKDDEHWPSLQIHESVSEANANCWCGIRVGTLF